MERDEGGHVEHGVEDEEGGEHEAGVHSVEHGDVDVRRCDVTRGDATREEHGESDATRSRRDAATKKLNFSRA